MKTGKMSLLFAWLVGVIGLSLVGCAAGPGGPATHQSLPEMLQAAGFKAYIADTPQKMAYLQTCPSNVLVTHERQGQRCYAFTDPKTGTVYLGDKAAYDRLEQALSTQTQKVDEKRIESDPQFWNMWESMQGGGG